MPGDLVDRIVDAMELPKYLATEDGTLVRAHSASATTPATEPEPELELLEPGPEPEPLQPKPEPELGSPSVLTPGPRERKHIDHLTQ